MPKRKTTEEFIADARKVHGDKYDYSKVEYINSTTKVCIVCPKHGEFWQRPNDHLRGHGCDECANNKPLTTETFILKARDVFGDFYNYDSVEYVSAYIPVKIKCPIHGYFHQAPYRHLYGCGCKKCANDANKHLVQGVGINDMIDGKKLRCYRVWIGMLSRGYNSHFKENNPTYTKCYVCEEWHTLSRFNEWFEDPVNGYQEGYDLDKDILVKGNKVYSPETCCFVPHEINSLILKNDKSRGKYPIGVRKIDNLYIARISLSTTNKQYNRKYIGSFSTPETAFLAYKKAKEHYVKELAEKYFKEGKITERVYNALLNYQVEITD